MKLIYIAGRFSGENLDEIERNISIAEDAARIVIQHAPGWLPVVPHSLGRSFAPGAPLEAGDYEYWCEGTLELLRRCDAVLAAQGWSLSSGTLLEISEAERLGIPIYYSADEFLSEI